MDVRSEESLKRRDNIVEMWFKDKEQINLYHYTSMSALYGIICDKELWLGSTATMNDKSEIKYYILQMQEALKEDIPDKNCDIDEFFGKIFKKLSHEYPYVTSFTTLYDDAAFWQLYGDNGKGVCLQFNAKNLYKIFMYNAMLLNQVYYDYDVRKHELFDIIKKYIVTGELTGKIDDVINNLIICSAIHKNHSFRYEEEIRLAITYPMFAQRLKNLKYSVDYELKNGKIIKFFKVNLEKLCEFEKVDFCDLFDQIIVGPESRQNIEILEDFLKEYRCEKLIPKITTSKCPL